MMSYIKDFILEVLVPVFVVVLALIFVISCFVYGASYFIDRPSCDAFGKLTGQETFYSLGTNCVVKYNGEWVDYSVATKKKQEITIKNQ